MVHNIIFFTEINEPQRNPPAVPHLPCYNGHVVNFLDTLSIIWYSWGINSPNSLFLCLPIHLRRGGDSLYLRGHLEQFSEFRSVC